MEYIAGLSKSDGCFICEAVAAKSDEERRGRLVLWSSEQSIILINRYPYTNGHLLIAPKAHKAELDELILQQKKGKGLPEESKSAILNAIFSAGKVLKSERPKVGKIFICPSKNIGIPSVISANKRPCQ